MNILKPKKDEEVQRFYITEDDLESLKSYRDAKSNAHEIAEKEFKILDRLVTRIEKQNHE